MTVVSGCGAGLVAAGGIALLLTLAAPERPLRTLFVNIVGEAELARRDRNARSGSRIGAVATVVGSLLLLTRSDDWSANFSAVGGGMLVALCLWLYLAYEVRRSYLMLLSAMQTSLGATPLKRAVYQSQAIYVGMGGHYEIGLGMADMPVAEPETALAKARVRTSWRWALLHPFGARGDGM